MNRSIQFFVLFLSFATMHSATAFPNRDIGERVKPISKTRADGPRNPNVGVAVGVPAAAVAAAISRNPQDIYGQYCTVCHQQGLAGAPRFRSEDWKSRLAGRNIQELLKSAIQGINAMPPRGTCANCTDDELRQAIEYMLPRK